MPFNDIYRKQVSLLVRVLPAVAEQDCFALKGGTAINLFVRDMPRLSVDIDLTYVPVQSRQASLKAINAGMQAIAKAIEAAIPGTQITSSKVEGAITTLHVRARNAQIKIEVTPVLRGCVHEPRTLRVSPAVEESFGFAETQVVSFADLYGGKIVAALDRQHPRDFFDVRDLLANEGIDDVLRNAFVVYLLSHNRPMAEVLAAKRKPLDQEFVRGFQGMTAGEVTIEELVAARETLVETMVRGMPKEHRTFLIGFERGKPNWPSLGLTHVSELPAIKWRQRNLDTLPEKDRSKLVAKLEEVLA